MQIQSRQRKPLLFLLAMILAVAGQAQQKAPAYTRLDTLAGSNTVHRAWWDVLRYEVAVTPDFATKSLRGRTSITYRVLPNQQSDYLQVDLQPPLSIDSIYYNGRPRPGGKPYFREGAHWFIPLPREEKGSRQSVTVVYHGVPKEAVNPPWDGGWIWAKDEKGRPWMSVACEGDGASLWFPCKDSWDDEPDEGATLAIAVPENLVAVGNGRLQSKMASGDRTVYQWAVQSPINAYNIIPYIGHYTNWTDTLSGEKGRLDLSYWVLDYALDKAKKQFAQVKPTLRSFEHWFGPYPFYADGYQLVQAPHLGMEHQSAVAYGNGFANGYLGTDLSGTGWGLKWDYIIVHETGHEWFGNNITAKDRADMWIHEAFTDYSETLFIESYYGKKAADEYVQGLRRNIQNDRPIIAAYGVNKEGSGDMYFKGANMLHTIRQVLNDDQLFHQMLRGLNKTFARRTVTSAEVEEYISREGKKDFSKLFDQYLRTAHVPSLAFRQQGRTVQYRWQAAVTGFAMPVRLTNGQWLTPTTNWQTTTLPPGAAFAPDQNFYVNLKKL